MPLSILFAAPGHYMVPTAGGARVVLEVCAQLADRADVTAAFRALPVPGEARAFSVTAIEPEDPQPDDRTLSSNAASGLSPARWYRYYRALERFAGAWATRVDCVIEYGWRGSGLLCRAFERRGVPSLAAEHFPRAFHTGSLRTPRQCLSRLGVAAAEHLAVRYLRRAPLVLAETEHLRRDLTGRLELREERVRTAPLGVDTRLFSPRPQSSCRAALGLPDGPAIWLYVGGMDMYHDMRPCLRAAAEAARDDILLVLLGTGVMRHEWERTADRANGRTVIFAGTVPHENVPAWIGAADLCLAPYCAERFPGRAVTFSTLKVREYMACGRPVVTVPGGTLQELVAHGETGFVLENTTAAWHRFVGSPPTREELRAMSPRILERAPSRGWDETADAYLAACREAVAHGPVT